MLNSLFFTQVLLLRESWKELFLLHLAQWSLPWDLKFLLNNEKTHNPPSHNMGKYEFPKNQFHDGEGEFDTNDDEIRLILETFTTFKQLSPDNNELGCLKAIVLFSPGKLFH